MLRVSRKAVFCSVFCAFQDLHNRGSDAGRFLSFASAFVFAACMAAYSTPSAAQIAVSPVLEPSRIDQNFEQAPNAKAEPRPVEDVRKPRTGGELPADLTFTLRDLRIEGATVLSRDELLAGWDHAAGDTVSVAELDALADRISRAYSDKGYALSFAFLPAQEIEDGVVSIRVVEGFVEKVVLAGPAVSEGTLGPSRAVVEQMASKITAARPLTSAALERYLLLINDQPGLVAKATLSPSQDAAGGSVMTLEISRDPVSAELGYNSFLPRELKRHAVAASVRFNGYVTGSDELWLSTIHSLAQGAYRSVGGQFSTGLGSEGLRLDIGGNYSRTRPTVQELEDIDYVGEAVSARVGVSYPLIRSRERNLNLSAAFNLENSDIDVLSTPLQRDRLRTIEAAASYDFVGAGRSVNLVRLGLIQGLDILDARGDSRANASPTHTVITLDLQTDVPLAPVGKGRLSLFGSAYAQVAARKSLLSAAECGFGGRQYGRSFDAGIATGDHCLLGSVELRWTAPLDVEFSQQPVGVQLYGVADFGAIRQRGALQPGEPRSEYGASAGAGLRASLSDRLSASVEATHSLKTPASQIRDEGFRLSGALSVRF